jgi:hypothetical protein
MKRLQIPGLHIADVITPKVPNHLTQIELI